ncbi:MAG: bifunctional folylpolyglutamate synthase/dihydrofolate synthase [Candidatus Kapaibacterium sp.]
MKQEILDRLYALHRFGIKPGLERTLRLAEMAGNPHSKYPSVHIAGTNGKGSTASMLASVFMEAGYKTGLYTSPHISDFNERIKVNGIMIDDDSLISLASPLLDEAESNEGTFFEITTVMAFKYFEMEKVDIAIIETGMGGRFDSTNIITPELSIITDIDMDHSEYLGDTLKDIAFEKAGVIKNDVPALISDEKTELREVWRNKAAETGSKIYYTDNYVLRERTCDLSLNTRLTISSPEKNFDIESPLAGIHQTKNIRAVCAAFDILQDKFNINENNLLDGISKVRTNSGLSARVELLRESPPIVADVAHNPAALNTLSQTLKECGYENKWDFLFAAMNDKDIRGMIKSITPHVSALIVTRPKIERAAKAIRIADIASEEGIKNIIIIENTARAAEFTFKNCQNLIIAGSFYLAGEALPVIKDLLKD